MSKLDTLEQIVREILTVEPRTRDDDRELTLQIWTRVYGINPWSPVTEVMRNKTLPSQESLGRVRRKIQMTDETLRGSKAKERVRMDAQEDFIVYSQSN